ARPFGPAPAGEDDGPNVPGRPEKSAHRHYERLPRVGHKGGVPGPEGESRRDRPLGSGTARRAGARSSGARAAAAGAFVSAVDYHRKASAEAPAIPSSGRRKHVSGRGEDVNDPAARGA